MFIWNWVKNSPLWLVKKEIDQEGETLAKQKY